MKNITCRFMDVKAVMPANVKTVVCVLPNFKEARLVDFCGLRENSYWIRSMSSSYCSVFPLLFSAEHYQFLEFALNNVRSHYLKVHVFHIEFCSDAAFS
jgi:hypothetical protein